MRQQLLPFRGYFQVPEIYSLSLQYFYMQNMSEQKFIKIEPRQEPYVQPLVQQKQKRKRKKIIRSQKSASQEQSYQPDFNQYKKVGLPLEMKRVKTGGWSVQQNQLYLKFLYHYKSSFSSEETRRKAPVFNRLSKALRKRTPDQCRSHHQKLQNRFKNNLQLIIEFVQSKIAKGKKGQQQNSDKYLELAKTTTTNTSEVLSIDFIEINVGQVETW